MNLRFGRISEKDFKACAYELMEAFEKEPWNEKWTYEQAYDRIDGIMGSKISRGYVIYHEEEVVAMACGRIMTYLSNKELWIDELSVNPRYQRMGIGKKLFDFIEGEIASEKDKISHILLNTEKGYPSVDFYKANGFIEVNSSVLMAKKRGL